MTRPAFLKPWLAFAVPLVCITVLAPASADPAFFRTLLDKKKATVSDAARVMVILHTKNRNPATFQQDLQTLRQAGIVPKRWKWTADKPVTCGEVAYMLCKVLGIKGGLTMRVTGITQRYAFRECSFRKLIPPTHQSKHLTGEELVAITAKAERYMRRPDDQK